MKAGISLGTRELYEFGPYRLDAAERRVLRDGQPVPLTPKAFDTLLVLIRRAGALVTKDELLAAVWPDVVVEEATLAQNISTLRKALGETPYIETVPKSGYRFVGEVRRPVVGGSSRTLLIAGLLLVAALAAVAWIVGSRPAPPDDRPRSVAIAPFRNLRPSPETDYLGASLADAVSVRLGELPQLIVRPSSYLQKYAGQTVDPRQLASEVKADTVLTGTFVREGATVRVALELVDIARGDVVWRDTIDVEFDRLLSVQDRIARRVVEGLNMRLSSDQLERFARGGPKNARAYDLYLRGLEYRHASKWGQGIAVLEESVSLDPNYAPAWVSLGWVLYGHGLFQGGGETFTRRALDAFDRALAIDPQSVEASIAKGMYFLESGQVERAAPVLTGVVRLNPNFAMGRWWLGYAYRYAGLLEESLRETNTAFSLDPLVGTGTSSNTYLYAGDHARFLDTLPSGESARTTFYRGMGVLYTGDAPRAIAEFAKAHQLDPSLIHARVGNAMRHALLQTRDSGLMELRRIENLDKPSDGEMLYKVAQAYAMLEAKDDAFRVLGQAIEHDFVCVPYFERDVLLATLRDDPRFAPMIERARERQRELRTAFQ